jgi:hypothetical protein
MERTISIDGHEVPVVKARMDDNSTLYVLNQEGVLLPYDITIWPFHGSGLGEWGFTVQDGGSDVAEVGQQGYDTAEAALDQALVELTEHIGGQS